MDQNLLLFPEHAIAVADATGNLARGVAQQWLDPTMFDEIVGVDFGLGKMHCYLAHAGRRRSVDIAQAISLLSSFRPKTLIVCEWAHLAVPQTHKSLSQPFDAIQLRDLYVKLQERGIVLKLFPHAHSGTRAREWVAHRMKTLVDSKKTSDINDAISIALYVLHCNEVSLADPPNSFRRCVRRDYGRSVTEYSNIVLNAERTRGYKGVMFPHVVELARVIRKKAAHSAIDRNVSISIASTVVHEFDGRPVVFVRNGRIPGAWMWLRNVMRFSPWHHRGGIARSNVWRHKWRPWFAKFAARRYVSVKSSNKYVKPAHFNAKQMAVSVAAKKEFRTAFIRAYRIAAEAAEAKGWDRLDLAVHQREASNGC